MLTKWVKQALPKFESHLIIYVKPLSSAQSIFVKKSIKNIKIISNLALKSSIFLSNIKFFTLYTGKLGVVYFKYASIIQIRLLLDVIRTKMLVPLLYYCNNRFIQTDLELINNQIYTGGKNLSKFTNLQSHLNNHIIYNMLKFHSQNISNFMIIKYEN